VEGLGPQVHLPFRFPPFFKSTVRPGSPLSLTFTASADNPGHLLQSGASSSWEVLPTARLFLARVFSLSFDPARAAL